MPAKSSSPAIPLPRAWHSRVKSAILHVISLAQFTVAYSRGWAADSLNTRVRLKAERDQAYQELALAREEMRIKDSRMARIPPHRRPFYPPTERMSILELKAARGWPLEQTARAFLVTAATISSWLGRLDEQGPDALVQLREPVNRFPDFVRYAVQRLKLLCPALGKVKIVETLARAGLHLGATTVGRILKEAPRPAAPKSESAPVGKQCVVTAKYSNHLWHVDLTAQPTLLGLCCSWLPFALPQSWPFAWWLALAEDHFSRRVMGYAIFRKQPTSEQVHAMLGRAIGAAAKTPRYLICDRGRQFDCDDFRRWCRRKAIKPRYGAIGKHGSLAVIERLILTVKLLLRCLPLVPLRDDAMRREIGLIATWYNGERPHLSLGGRTPDEVYFDRFPANLAALTLLLRVLRGETDGEPSSEARRKARREKQRRSEEFPEHIEHRERTFDLSDEEKQGLKCIGVQITKRLRFEKPHLYVEVTKRPQYVVPGQPEQGVRSVPPPLAIVEGCKYDFSLIAAMLAMKFAFHVPTYRQQDWFAQCGWYPRRATTNDLVNYSVATIGPLFEQMWRLLLAQPILLGDDTRIRVLLRGALDAADWAALKQRGAGRPTAGAGPPKTGPPGSALSYAWLYTSLDGLAPYNVFHWSLMHRNEVIDGHLATYRGIFVGDACGANARLQQRSDGRITHAGCNAHARREFVNAEANDPLLASQAISFYRQLYDVEERAVTLDAVARQALRQRDAAPIWNRMRRWLESDAARRALPQSAIGKALGYLHNHWTSLTLYLGDGRIPIDNDQSERIIRPLTVGRANWLFLGHPRAAAGRLRLYSIVSSAHRHHLVIEDYLEDILRQLADAQQNHPADLALGSPYLLDLLPDRWAAAH